MERAKLEHDLQVLREMARDMRGAARVSAASGERKMRELSLSRAEEGQELMADFLAARQRQSEESSDPTGEQLRWMRQVVADGLLFFSPRTRDMARLYYCGSATLAEIGAVFQVGESTVCRILARVRRRLRSYAQDRRRLRRELEGDDLDLPRLLAELQCLTPRQRQVLELFFGGQRNYEIALDLQVCPSTVCRTRQRGAGKLERLGEDAQTLKLLAEHGQRALYGPLRLERSPGRASIIRNASGTQIRERKE